MNRRRALLASSAGLLAAAGRTAADAGDAAPLVIGETFTLRSRPLGEVRRINVYRPAGLAKGGPVRLPALYMPDGGLAEDFLHIAGLVQVGVANGTVRPHLLVGVENTQRRRDLTGPTRSDEDRKIAPAVGGSAAFRAFLRDELFAEVKRRYDVTAERAIVGESLAGLFVAETLLREPDLFDTYLAVDPSLWWDREGLTDAAAEALEGRAGPAKTLFLASSGEDRAIGATRRFAVALERAAPAWLRWRHEDLPEERHATVFHPAALRALRWALRPAVGA